MWPWRRRSARDFEDEIEAHLELETERQVDAGREPGAAREAARRSFGSLLTARERFHESRPLAWLDHAWHDLRYAWRSVLGHRAFAATIVLTLAVALGLTTVVFTVFNAYVLRPFAVQDPFALYEIVWRSRTAAGRTFTWRDYEAIDARTDLFDGVVAERQRFVLSDGRRVAAALVSGNYFETLQPRLLLGRGLARGDAPGPGREPVAVLSHHAWTRLFNRDPEVVGRTLPLNGRPFTIVGVARPEFVGLDEYPRDVWIPLTLYGELIGQDLYRADSPREIALTGRLRRDVPATRAAAALTPQMIRALGTDDSVKAELRPQATPTPLSLELLGLLSPVFAAFGLVLVAACANVSNVMLARANARHREIGVRLSLGASRARVVRQLLTEGLLLALLASVAALALATVTLGAGLRVLVATLPASLGAILRVVPLELDRRVLAFSLAVAGLTTLMFAWLPALHATRLSLTHALRGEASSALGASRLRAALVVSQVAVSLVLVVVAATLARNSAAVASVDLGFDTMSVLTVNQRSPGPSLIGRAAEVLAGDSRVALVAAASRCPLFGDLPKLPVRGTASANVVPTTYQFVSPAYFPLLGIPILRGRAFTDAEGQAEAAVGIISAAGARALWGAADPIGRTVRVRVPAVDEGAGQTVRTDRLGAVQDDRATTEVTIVGVARDVVSTFVYVGKDPAHLYLPTSPAGVRASALLVRGPSSAALSPDVAETLLRPLHANPLALEVVPIDEMRGLQMYPLRAASWVGTTLAAIALALSISGLYGVLVYSLSQRVREIGIRMALGASASAVVRLIVRQSISLAALGASIGLATAFVALKALSSIIRLQHVSVLDVGAFMTGTALIGAAVVVASYWPARRATRVDPASTLRADG